MSNLNHLNFVPKNKYMTQIKFYPKKKRDISPSFKLLIYNILT